MKTFAVNTSTSFILDGDYQVTIQNVCPYEAGYIDKYSTFVAINNNDPINQGIIIVHTL